MKEIERRFLLGVDEGVCLGSFGVDVYIESITQGYLFSNEDISSRIRIIKQSSKDYAILTIKKRINNISREEIEVTVDDMVKANSLLSMCEHKVEKIRKYVLVGKHVWSIDFFTGNNAGLVLAEVELKYENEEFVRPEWAKEEVTEDPKYLSCNLAKNPYKEWR